MRRNRLRYAIAGAVTIALGLGSRSGVLPAWLAKDAGDVLYAVLVFLVVALIAPRAATWKVAAIALSFCAAIETLQAVDADWLDRIRDTLPGRLVLGRVFEWLDFARYAIGIAAAALIERSGSPDRAASRSDAEC